MHESLARRAWGAATAVALSATFLLFPSPAHAADAAAPVPAAADPALPATATADVLPTPQINGVVWKQVIVGNTVYVGGDFQNARPFGSAPGVNTVTRTNMLAYNLTTGELDPSFAPTFDAKVSDMAVTPDKTKLIVVGPFTTVNGQTRDRAAVFNLPADGSPNGISLSTTVVPDLNGVATSVAATNSAIYFGGWFSAINNDARNRVGAVSATNGSLLPFTVPVDNGQLNALTVSPDGTKVVLGGNFTSVGGSSAPGYGLYMADATTGAGLPLPVNTSVVRDAGVGAGIIRLASDDTSFYGTGWVYGTGSTEGVFQASWTDGSLVTLDDCHGDSYDAAPIGGVVYVASHKHYCGNSGGFPQTAPNWTFWHSTAWTKAPMGTNTSDIYGYADHPGTPRGQLLPFFPQYAVGTYTGQYQATWTVTGNSNYVLYGGEFTGVDGIAQQGLVRYGVRSVAPDKVGPQTQDNNSFTPTVHSLANGEVRVSWPALWDRDDATLTYQLYRNDSSTKIYETKQTAFQWNGKSMTFTDTGQTPGASVRYAVRVIDSDGNYQNSTWATTTVASANQLDNYGSAVMADGASKFWRLDDTGTTVDDLAGADTPTEGAGVTGGAAGAMVNSSDTAVTLSGTSTGQIISKELQAPGPNTYSYEVWFKTSTTSGGKIAGFGDGSTGNSNMYDRTLYMDTSGRINYAVRQTVGTRITLQSGTGLNDDKWHQAVATLGTGGMSLYIDGKPVANRSDVTNGLPYGGYWRLGADSTFSGANTFTGSLDDFSVYPTQLTRQQVDSHYVASGRTSALPVRPSDALGQAMYDSSPDLYWRLEETSGTTAADSASGLNTGTFTGTVTKNRPGVTAAEKGVALTANGNVTSTTSWVNPTTFSQEVWVKTSTTTGGRIFGFGNSKNGSLSTYFDRALYMLDNGKVRFGGWGANSAAPVTIDSTNPLNDNQWHQLVTTFDSSGMKLYVDGVLNSSNPNAVAQNYTGYWKLGGDQTWGGNTSRYFVGDVDEAAIYSKALAASDVRKHYLAGGGTVPNVAPTAAFTSTSNDTVASFDASGSSDSDGTVASYAWDFGDGTTGTGQTPTHTYAKAGIYTVQLTVTDDQGATNPVSHDVTVTHTNVKPTAGYTWSADKLNASFDGSTSVDTDGTIATYAWDFGDNSTGTGKTPTHAYAADGVYKVKLTVTDDSGATDTASQDVTVTAGKPVASDAFGRAVTGGWGTADNGGAWTIGGQAGAASVSNGVAQFAMPGGLTESADLNSVSSTSSRVSTEFSLDKLYTGTGEGIYVGLVGREIGSDEYVARLVLQPNGQVRMYLLRNWTTLASSVVVPNLTLSAGTHYKFAMQVTGTSPTTVSAKVWKASDTEPAAWQMTGTDSYAPLQAPGAVGLFEYVPGGTPNAPITTSFYNFLTTNPTLTNVKPTAAFTSSVNTLKASLDASTSVDTDGSIISYAWDFGDATSGTGKTATHSYSAGGTYAVKLTVTDDAGATDTITKNVTVTSAAANVLASDSFQGATTAGWGAADVGGTWTIGGQAGAASVSNGVAQFAMPGGLTESADLNSVSSTSSRVSTEFSLDKLYTGTGEGIYVGLVGREIGSDEYVARLVLQPNGQVRMYLLRNWTTLASSVVVPNLTLSAGTHYKFAMQVTGTSPTTVSAKVWKASDTEPAAWQMTGTDSYAPLQAPGAVGLFEYVPGGTPNAPITTSFYSFLATKN